MGDYANSYGRTVKMILKTYYHPEIQKTFYIDEDLSEDIPVYTISVVFKNALIVIGQYRGKLVDVDDHPLTRAEMLEVFLDEFYTDDVKDEIEKEMREKDKRDEEKDAQNFVLDIGEC